MATNQSATRSIPESRFQVGQRFNPYKRFLGIVIPEPVCKYRGVSLGAKLVYGRLCRYAGENGDAYPSVPTLGRELGISGKQARRYLRELEARKFIQSDPKPGERSHYFFLWHQAFSIGEVGIPRKAAPLPKMGAKESHHQESQNESQKRERAGGWGMGGSGGETIENPQAKPKKNLPGKEEKPPTRTPFANSDMEFSTRIMERHGNTVDADILLKTVLSELNGFPLAELLQEDLKVTTAPGRLSNPNGYYRDLARKVGRRKEAERMESLFAEAMPKQGAPKPIKPAEPLRDLDEYAAKRAAKPSCTCNDGRLPGGGYCACKVGGALRDLDVWAKAAFKPPHKERGPTIESLLALHQARQRVG
jgi:Helix-turn-helix domain